MSDLMQEMADREVVAPPQGGSSDIPDKLRVVVQNTTSENGKAAPTVKDIGKEKSFHKFKTGLIIVGGEKKAEDYNGRYIFLDYKVHKPTDEMLQDWLDKATDEGHIKRLKAQITANPKLPLDGELYNFMLDTLAPTGEDVQDRWKRVMAVICAKATEKGYTGDAFGGDAQLMVATVFKDILLDNAYNVIGQTYTPKQRAGSTYTPGQTLGSVEAFTEETAKKRKVALFDNTRF